MKKTRIFTALILVIILVFCLSACFVGGGKTTKITIDGVEYEAEVGSLLPEPQAPEKASTAQYEYTFDGWYKEGTDEKWNFSEDKITENLSLVSKFTETLREYQIKIGSNPIFTAAYGSKLVKPEDPVKEDAYREYEFAGWFKDPQFKNEWNFETDVVTGTTILYAKFNSTDKSFNVIINSGEPVSYVLGSLIQKPEDPEVPTDLKLTHVFDKWVVKETNKEWNFATDRVQSDMELVATYKYMFRINVLPEKTTLLGKDYNIYSITAEQYAAMSAEIKTAEGTAVKYASMNDGVIYLPITSGEYTFTVTVAGVTAKGSFTADNTDSYSVYVNQPVTIGGKSGDLPSWAGNSWNTTGDTLNMWSHAYVYIGNGERTDKVYIEADIHFPQAALGAMVGIMPACENISLEGNGGKKLTFSVSYGNTLYSQILGGWGGDKVEAKATNVAASNTDYKLGVLRYGNVYFVFVDGELKLTYKTNEFEASGFGFACVNPNGGLSQNDPFVAKNIRYITDGKTLDEFAGDFLGTATINRDSSVVTLSQNEKTVEGSSVLASSPIYLTFTVPEGKVISGYAVSCNSGAVKVYENGNEIYFYPEKGKVYNVSVALADKIEAVLTLNLKPYAVRLNDTEYKLNDFDINKNDVKLTVLDVTTGTVTAVTPEDLAPTVNVTGGKYIITAKYLDNVTETSVIVSEKSASVDIYLSDAYMGGWVTGGGYTAKSYNGSGENASSGANWKLYEGMRDTVSMSNYTFVYYKGLYGTTYYSEAYFDTDLPNYRLNTSNKFTGIMIASKHVNLDGGGTGANDKMKIFAGIYGKSIVLTSTNGWSASNTVTIANYSDVLGETLPERVKLGVLRDGTTYYFFVNDVFVAKKTISLITNACGVGVANLENQSTIYKFNASTNAELIAALKSQATEQSGQIDLYVIAGQSNASGYTVYDNDTMLARNESLVYGNNNVLYAGRAQFTNGNSVGSNEYGWGLARVGQGAGNDKMSAEAAMSTVLSSYYNKESGKVAGIIKFAHGGTALLNNLGGENAVGGNWVPPSYAKAKGYNYENNSLTGRLYRDLLTQVTKRVNELKADGYTEINIKGVWWMQGEADKGNPTEYKVALEYLISDMRKDLGTITNEDLSNLPFIIGEISRTSGDASTGTVNTNNAFIAMQDEYANTHENVYINKIGHLDINKWVNGNNVAVGTDSWHWNQNDMVTIGQDVGRIILEKILKVKA